MPLNKETKPIYLSIYLSIYVCSYLSIYLSIYLKYMYTWVCSYLSNSFYIYLPISETGVQSQFEPNTQKIVVDASMLNTRHYKVWIKGKILRSPLHLGILAIEKGAFGTPSTTVGQLTNYIVLIIGNGIAIDNNEENITIKYSFCASNYKIKNS